MRRPHEYGHYVIEGTVFASVQRLHSYMETQCPGKAPPLHVVMYRLRNGPLTWKALYAPVNPNISAATRKAWDRRKQEMADVIKNMNQRNAAMKDPNHPKWEDHKPIAKPLQKVLTDMTKPQTPKQPRKKVVHGANHRYTLIREALKDANITTVLAATNMSLSSLYKHYKDMGIKVSDNIAHSYSVSEELRAELVAHDNATREAKNIALGKVERVPSPPTKAISDHVSVRFESPEGRPEQANGQSAHPVSDANLDVLEDVFAALAFDGDVVTEALAQGVKGVSQIGAGDLELIVRNRSTGGEVSVTDVLRRANRQMQRRAERMQKQARN